MIWTSTCMHLTGDTQHCSHTESATEQDVAVDAMTQHYEAEHPDAIRTFQLAHDDEQTSEGGD